MELMIKVEGNEVMVGEAKVVQTDVMTSNGVICPVPDHHEDRRWCR